MGHFCTRARPNTRISAPAAGRRKLDGVGRLTQPSLARHDASHMASCDPARCSRGGVKINSQFADEFGMRHFILILCAAGALLAGCKKEKAVTTAPPLPRPDLQFVRWRFLYSFQSGAVWADGMCKNVGAATACRPMVNCGPAGPTYFMPVDFIAPGDSGNFGLPAEDSMGVWTYPTCPLQFTWIDYPPCQ